MKIVMNGYPFLIQKLAEPNRFGALGFAEALILSIKKLGKHEVSVIHMALRSKGFKGKPETKGRYQNLVFVELAMYFGQLEIYRAKQNRFPKSADTAIDAIEKILAKIKPDVVICNGFITVNWFLIKAAERLNIPVVTIHHGLWFSELKHNTKNAGLTKFGLQLCRRMESDTLRIADKMVFLSKLSLANFEKQYGKIPAKQKALLATPYNQLFANKTKPLPPKAHKDLRIGMVGRWDPIKNHEAVLALAKEARKQGLPWKFAAVTSMRDHKNLNHVAREYKKYIEVRELMEPRQLKKFYQSCDVLLLPSRFDVLGMVVMEALLQNRLTIISKNVGWVDLYKRFGMGTMIADFSSPKKVINLIMNRKSLAPKPNFYQFVKTNYQPDTVFKKLIQIINTARHENRSTRQ